MRWPAILHTHHHRDQAQGDHKAAAAGIPIHVPQHERHLFDQVETFWTTKQLYDMYNVRNTYFTLTKSVPVAGVLEDWGRFEWKGVSLEVVPTPGHTVGSISLRGRLDGVEVAFVGDLLFSPGKVQTLYDMQYSYGATDGVESAILSLNLLEDRGPAVLCPSHGGVMRDCCRGLCGDEGRPAGVLPSPERRSSGGRRAGLHPGGRTAPRRRPGLLLLLRHPFPGREARPVRRLRRPEPRRCSSPPATGSSRARGSASSTTPWTGCRSSTG